MNDLHVRPQRITPAIAAAWLEQNIEHNRNVKDDVVTRYSRDMQQGRWRLNGDSIRFDVDGNLVDGQHRLMACIRAGKPFSSLVVTGLQPEDFGTIDNGRARSAADYVGMAGGRNATMRAALAKMILHFEHGHDPLNGNAVYSRQEIVDRATQDDLDEAIAWAVGGPIHRLAIRMTGARLGVFLFWYWTQFAQPNERPELFFEGIGSGLNLPPGSPELALRNRVSVHEKMPALDRAYLTIVAFRHWYRGRPVTRLMLPKRGVPEFQYSEL